MGMTRKQLEQAIKDSPNKESILKQVDDQIREQTTQDPPFHFFFPGFRIKSYNQASGKWAKINAHAKAKKAFSVVPEVVLPKKKRFLHLLRIIPPRGRRMDGNTENLRVGFKSLVDQMKNKGYIVDDADKWIDTQYDQEKIIESELDTWGVKISVYDLDEEGNPVGFNYTCHGAQ